MIFDDKKFCATKIKQARKKVKLTQEELAEKIGISAKQFSRIEVATYIPSLPTFLKIVKELKIDLKEFGIDEQQTNSPMREEFLKFIYKLDDKELEFYLNCLKTISENVKLIKN